MIDTVTIAIVNFFFLAAVLTPLELLFSAKSDQRWWRRRSAKTDAVFFAGQYLVWSAMVVGALQWIVHWLDHPALASLRTGFAELPLWLGAVIAVVLGDFAVYWFHRACHANEFLWRFHAVHHSSEELDWLAAHREHPVDGLLTQICQNLPAILFGLHFELLAAFIVFRATWAVFIHSNVRIPLGPLRVLFGAPELHHYHHLRADRTAHNFANLAPWIDVLFGTYHRPRLTDRFPIGLTEAWPKGYFAQLAHPFRVSWRNVRSSSAAFRSETS